MKKIKRLLSVTLLTFYIGTTFCQTTDSLSVFPNPFGSSATIHFDIVHSDTITLKVLNAVGQTVKTFFESTLLPGGSYNLNLNGDSLADGIYFIRLDIGSTKTINKKAVKNGLTSGISANKVINKFIIFPNPTFDDIKIPINGNKTIIITDLNGKMVKTYKTDQQIISLFDIPSGQYFITILTNHNGVITTQKIVKNE